MAEFDAVKIFDDSRAARSESQSKSPARYFIERRRAHRDERRAARENIDYACREIYAGCMSGEFGQNSERVMLPRFGHPETIIARSFSRTNTFE